MDRVEVLAWLARRQVWEDRLRELETPGGTPTMLTPSRRVLRSSGPRAVRDQGRRDHERTPVAKAS